MTTTTANRLTECYRALDAIGVDFTPENVEKLRAFAEHSYPWDMTETAWAAVEHCDWEDWTFCVGFDAVWDVVADEWHSEVWDLVHSAYGITGASAFVKGYGYEERRAIVDELDTTSEGNGAGPLVIPAGDSGNYYARKA